MICAINGQWKLYEDFATVRPEGTGITYQVFITFAARQALVRAEKEGVGMPSTLKIWHHQSESGDTLFGFLGEKDADLYHRIRHCDKVGPKTAMNVMQLGSVQNIVQAINLGNSAYLAGAVRVSKDTANRILLKLQGNLKP